MTRDQKQQWKNFLNRLEYHISDGLVLLADGTPVNRLLWEGSEKATVEFAGGSAEVTGPKQFIVYQQHPAPFGGIVLEGEK